MFAFQASSRHVNHWELESNGIAVKISTPLIPASRDWPPLTSLQTPTKSYSEFKFFIQFLNFYNIKLGIVKINSFIFVNYCNVSEFF